MPLTGPRDMFAKALAGGFAVGAFNINNMETVQGILQAAGDERSPVILQVSNGARQYAGRGYLRKMAEAASEETDVPFVLHLDHGSGFDICKACIDDGFTSVMIDGSHLPFEENVAVTRRVVEYAHDRGVWVEAELGRLAGVEETVSSRESVYTDPEEAETFVARTGCDSLAIAIGTSHGPCKFSGEARLDFERLDAIAARLPGVPLVLHGASSVPQEAVAAVNAHGGNVAGASGVPEDLLRRAAASAICKINIDTDLRLAVTAAIRNLLAERPETFDPRAYLTAGREAVREMVRHKIRAVLGSSGQVQVPTEREDEVMVIPRQAVLENQGKSFVYVIAQDSRARMVPVATGPAVGSDRIAVISGITPESLVIYDGMAHIRQGMAVTNTAQ